MEVVIGTAAGVLAAVICTAFYTKGLRDGAKIRGTRKRKAEKEEIPDPEKELVRKFDMILDYDPYDPDGRERMQGEGV